MSQELSLFLKYAMAFEEAVDADDWTIVDVLFDEDITWSVAGLPSQLGYQAQGRKNASQAIKVSVDEFDRRFDERVPKPTMGPVAIPGGVHLEFEVTYTRTGLPPFLLQGEEWDVFRDGKIAMHFEVMHNAAEVVDYFAKYGSLLLPVT